jgi:hypothetical protein
VHDHRRDPAPLGGNDREEDRPSSAVVDDRVLELGARTRRAAPRAGRGRKFDGGKLRMDLLPAVVLRQMAAPLSYGAVKYGPDNYKSHDLEDGIARHKAALLRHYTLAEMGEVLDEEMGLHHWACVLSNAAMVVWAMHELRPDEFPEQWNRPPSTGESVHGERFDG